MLTLPEELLLLSLDDKGHSHDVPAPNLEEGLLAGAIYELQLLGRVDIEPDVVRVRDASPTTDPVLDSVLELLGQQEPAGALQPLLLAHYGKLGWLREKVMERLCERGVIRREEGRFLWLLPQQRYSVEHEAEELSLLERVSRALILQHKPDRRTSALLALIASCYTSDHHLRERLFSEMRDRMYELVNSGGEVQGIVRDSVNGALAAAAPPILPTLYGSGVQ
jgi:golgi phosphoprotein 3